MNNGPGCMLRKDACIFNRFQNDEPDKCEQVNGSCYIKGMAPQMQQIKRERDSENDANPEIIEHEPLLKLPNWIAVPQPQSQPQSQPDTLDFNDSTKTFVSGPVAMSHIVYDIGNGPVNLYLFSDQHYSMSGTCDMQCNDDNTNVSNNCNYISRLFKDIFQNAVVKQHYVDFFIELPFQVDANSPADYTDEELNNLGYLRRVHKTFNNCFTKNKTHCDYLPYVKFHDVDIRQLEKSGDEIMWSSFQKYLLLDRVSTQYNEFMNKITVGLNYSTRQIDTKLIEQNDPIIKQLDTTNQLMNLLYSNGGSVDMQLIKMYIESNNFTKEFQTILSSVTPDDDLIKYINDIKVSTVNVANGGNVHRIALQFNELNADGLGELANKIKQFIYKQYERVGYASDILKLWNEFYTVYKSFIRVKQTGFSGLSKLTQDNSERYIKIKNIMRNIDQTITATVVNNALLLDAYLLARLFRTYNTPKHQRAPGSNSNTKIIYAGHAHIEEYRLFFKTQLGAKEVHYSESIGLKFNRCVTSDIDSAAKYLN